MKKKTFHLLLLIFSLVITGMFISSCDDDDDDNGGGETTLTITSIDPATARVGETIAMNGTGFSTDRTKNSVKFTGSVSAAVTTATSTQLTVEVPEGAGDGPITVTVGEKTATSSQSFTLDTSLGAPELTSIDPTNGFAGTKVTITGTNFGEEVSVVKVYFNDVEVPEITSITNTTIVTTVPSGLEVGDATVKVVRDEVESSSLTFTVNQTPTSVKTVYWTSPDGVYKGIINDSGADISQLYDNSAGNPTGIEVDTDEGYIYWGNTSGQILKAPVSGEGPVETLYEEVGYVVDIAIDKTLQKIFIICTDFDNYTYEWVKSVNLDGSSNTPETLYAQDLNVEETGYFTVKLVVSNSKIYWTETLAKRVMVGSVNGSSEAEAVVLFDAGHGLNGPVGLAIDQENNKIYVVDNGIYSGTAESTIYSGNLNGDGSLSAFVEPGDNVNEPQDAEIDLDNGYLFWLNNTGGYTDGQVMRAKLDDGSVETLFGGIDHPGFFDLDIH